MRSRSLVLAALPAVLATAMFTSAAPAQAACTSSTPASQSFADPLGDATDPTNPLSSNLGPDVTLTTLQVDGGCILTGFNSYSNRSAGLLPDDVVFTHLDTDGNPATGDPVIGGADRIVGVLNGSPPMLGTYNPASDGYEFIGGPFLTPAGVGGFSATLDQLGIGPSTNLGVAVATLWDLDYFDIAPDQVFNTGLFRMGVSYSTAPPPAPPAPRQTLTNVTSCTVPSTKKMRLSTALRALRDAGCSVGLTRQSHSRTVKRGRVVKSSPPAGLSTNRSVVLYVSSGAAKRSRRAHRSSLSVAMRLDALSAALAARS